jgi:hypothetical protein
MAEISWIDSTGAATLASSWPAPADRFRNWQPTSRDFADHATGLGSGQRYAWSYREDYGASFEIPGIANTDVDLALRLQKHLEGGGIVEVETEDESTNTYSTCGIYPGTEVEIVLEDRAMLEYTVRLTVLNRAASPAPMLCEY